MTTEELRSMAIAVMRKNQQETDGFRYTLPSASSYPYQWLWDSCFNAITYSYLDPEYGKDELRALFAKQWPNGVVAHMLYWQAANMMPFDWGGPEKTSSLIQPPLIAYAVWQLYKTTEDSEFLQELYPNLKKFHEYLWRERVLKGRNLLGIVNPDESGEDNSPRFDIAQNLAHIHDVEENQKRRFALFDTHRNCDYRANECTYQFFWVEDVPFNVFAIASLEAMGKIAEVIGEDPSEWQRQATALHDGMRKHLLEDGSCWSSSGAEHTLIKSDTWARFAPLFVGFYTQDEAKALVEDHLKNPDSYALPYVLPTVAANDPAYDPKEPDWGDAWQHPHWRGPVWMMPNWCVYHGLKRYGFIEEAERIKTCSLELIAKSGFREYYHPDTGVGMGALNFTWPGLTLDMN